MLEMNIDVKMDNEKVIIPLASKEVIASINTEFAKENIDVFQISTFKKNLENVFIDLIKN
jgi:hypothetical protein